LGWPASARPSRPLPSPPPRPSCPSTPPRSLHARVRWAVAQPPPPLVGPTCKCLVVPIHLPHDVVFFSLPRGSSLSPPNRPKPPRSRPPASSLSSWRARLPLPPPRPPTPRAPRPARCGAWRAAMVLGVAWPSPSLAPSSPQRGLARAVPRCGPGAASSRRPRRATYAARARARGTACAAWPPARGTTPAFNAARGARLA
jgi:hypothetical protein